MRQRVCVGAAWEATSVPGREHNGLGPGVLVAAGGEGWNEGMGLGLLLISALPPVGQAPGKLYLEIQPLP